MVSAYPVSHIGAGISPAQRPKGTVMESIQRAVDQIVLWYGGLPSAAQMALTVAVGVLLAWAAFKIVMRVIKGLVASVIAAILVFLLTTMPGNMLLAQAFDRLEQQADSGTVSELPARASDFAHTVSDFVSGLVDSLK